MAGNGPSRSAEARITFTRDFEIVEMSSLSTTDKDKAPFTTTPYAVSTAPRPVKYANRKAASQRCVDGSRRVDGPPEIIKDGYYVADGMADMPRDPDRYYDLQAANARTANSALMCDLKGRHLQMIAIGGSIVGNSVVFGSSRTLAALAEQSHAPKILAYIDRKGRPLVSVLVSLAAGLLAHLVDLKAQGEFFDWLVAMCGLSSLFTWGSICLCHIRFRRACKLAGYTLDRLPFRSQAGTVGSYAGRGITKSFSLKTLAVPVVLAFYMGHRLWFQKTILRAGPWTLIPVAVLAGITRFIWMIRYRTRSGQYGSEFIDRCADLPFVDSWDISGTEPVF